MLKCLESLRAQTYDNHRVILVDNGSSVDILDEVAAAHPDVEIVTLDRNYGFSGGINRGVAKAAGADYVYLLNFDTVVEPGCVSEMVAVAEGDPGIVGVAPKILLADLPQIFDSVGTALGDNAGAFNQGIGQPDVGQYDMSERVFGACFGAALIRRRAFEPGNVGPLDESYFMYFEDFDWCFRANLMGEKFFTAPAAVVHHEHSASVKDKNYSFKFKLIELNLLRTVVKDYQRRQAVEIPLLRLRTHLRHATSRRSGSALVSARIIFEFLIDLPRLLPKRWEIQKRRRVRDLDILKYSYGEVPYFNPSGYSPEYTLDTLSTAYRRLYTVTGEEEALGVWKGLDALNKSKLRFDRAVLTRRLGQLLVGQPKHVLDFAAKIKAVDGDG